jgi:NAD(P)H-nitrite reductase large subunit
MSPRSGRGDVILCHCATVSEREVVACARRGALTLEDVAAACDAGTGCGSCRGAIMTILDEQADARARGDGVPAALLQLPLFGRGRR